jgi:hypothetical protein
MTRLPRRYAPRNDNQYPTNPYDDSGDHSNIAALPVNLYNETIDKEVQEISLLSGF